MMEEPFFLVNEFMEKDWPELRKSIDILKGPKIKDMERAVFLRNFTNNLFNAYRKQKHKYSIAEESETRKLEKLKLEKKRKELLEKLDKFKQIKDNETPIIMSEVSKQPLVKSSFTGSSYIVAEPKINKQDHEIINDLKQDKNILDNSELLKSRIKELCEIKSLQFSDEYFDKVRYYLIRDIKNYSKISPLVEDKNITEISCSGANTPVTLTYNGNNEIPSNIEFSSDEEINNFILGLAKNNSQEFSKENPFINFKIKDFAFQATLKTDFISPRFVLVKSI